MKGVLHFSGLNGLRAIAALSVLFSHTTTQLNSFGLNSYIFGSYDDGSPKATLLANFGVSIFFALSGFLISYLLLEEKSSNEINIKNFYIRRMLRIWPLYYLYLIVSVFTSIVFDLPFDWQFGWFYIFLFANIPYILNAGVINLGHYWSLGVEEQFYSFWPWVIKRSNSILKTTTIICLFLIILKCMLRYIDVNTNHSEMSWPYNAIHTTRFQCMLIGAIGAILYFQKNSLFIQLTNNRVVQSLSWFVILLVAINRFHIASVLDNEIISVVTVFLIIGQIEKKHRIINLDSSLFDFIGKISYGIYVIHPLTIFYLSKVIAFSDTGAILNYLLVYLSIFSATIILAYLSYEYFEKRFLSLKEKYSTITSSATKHYEEHLGKAPL